MYEYMLKRIHRLNHHEFKACFATGRRTHTPGATIVTSPALLWGVSVVVPKKVKKTAVLRNRLRRQVYAAIEKGVPSSKQHFIVILKPLPHTEKRLSKENIEGIISRINQLTVQ
jgi:ribonuclease P protein component